ncbi:TonB-dependent receptor [Carboxylicivirga mesophila]|uniref:TonB-dependent receptor n=1 Tax=Carboxylicivirga mesophila TaxID=1166478 RepID=A0ABS5K6Y9_9BACT|nr:TonB-dependent receptor [Carboxylicivirga mesophila]MBS2210687.1 TonB-dependent receptor [Carboxylicivirga mesophila]
MRLTMLFLIVSFMHVAASSYSQSKNSITLKLKNATVEEALKMIQNNSGIDIFFQSEMIPKETKVDLNAESSSIGEIMDAVLKHTDLTYRMIDENIVIVPKTSSDIKPIQQDAIVITGKVMDVNGEPLPGVNVFEKANTTHGVITGIDGTYSIKLSVREAVLTFSYIGFEEQSIVVGDRTQLDITLIEETTGLDEVVVVGYGAQKKVNLTGSVAKVDGDAIAKVSNPNTSKSLQGLANGITVIDRGGAPGGDDPQIFIRGVGTTGNSNPLILVDGVEMSLSDVPSADIENVSVLKDAASSAIYGSRAAHGVILVTTKRGKEGKMRVSYDGYVGVQDRAVKPKAVGAREYMEMVNEASVNKGNSPIFSEEDITITESGSDPYGHPYVVYPDEIYNANYITEHTIKVSGGTEEGKYLLSLNYLDQPGLTDNTSFKRYNMRLNTDFKIGQRMDVGADIQYRHMEREWPGGLGSAQKTAWSMVPTTPVQYENGNYALDDQNNNPVAYLDPSVIGTQNYNRDEVYAQLKASYELLEGLSVKGVAAVNGGWTMDKNHNRTHKFFDENDNYVNTWNPQSSVWDRRITSYQVTLRALANYTKNFNGVHDLNILAGAEQISHRSHYLTGSRSNLISDDMPYISLGDSEYQYVYSDIQRNGYYPVKYGLNSFFGRVNYGYKERYLVEANVRRDGSSRFAEGNKWGVFPSVSAAWRISQEEFMTSADFITNLKLRASWGQMGNERIGEFKYLPQYAVEDNVMNGNLVTGVTQYDMANSDISWETVELSNIGLDFSLFNGKLFGELEYYRKDTRDILLTLGIPTYIGLGAPEQNAGVVRNSGFETLLGYRKSHGDFRFTTTFNFSYNKNEWIDRASDDEFIDGWKMQKEGHALDAYYIFRTDGLIANEEELAEYKSSFTEDPRGINGLKPGDIKFVDVNGDGAIDKDDRQILHSNIPRFTFGYNFNAEYKGFDLSLFFQGATGANTYIYGEWYEGPSYGAFTGIHFRDRWTPENENPNASIPRLEAASDRNFTKYNDFFLTKNNYLRLKNAQLGYNLPSGILEKVNIEKARIYVSGTNLFTISNLDQGLDPESFDGRVRSYPTTKIISLGMNVTF